MKASRRIFVGVAILLFCLSPRIQAQSQTIFTTQTPQQVNQSDGSNVNYELGTVFQSNVAGQITAIRFWKDSRETGSHTGRVWSSSGQVLVSVAFASESASGWQTQSLPNALSIPANTTYVVTVNTGGTYYVASEYGLASQVRSQHLSTIVGRNGVYGRTGRFPATAWNASNYFRDVVFVPLTSGGAYSISGTTSGSGGNGATVTLGGASSATTTASSSGSYSFAGMANGSYTVTPSHSGFTFGPSSQNATVSGGNASVPAFTATAVVQTFTISGTISGSGGNGATVTLGGASSATTMASSSGSYSFAGMANGSYTVTPSHSGFTFGPSSQNATVSGGNASVPAFTATAVVQTFTISGTISGSGGNGATVTLSGASSATATANASGAYSFAGMTNGSYTVTPSHSGFTFGPTSQNATVSGGNASVPVFTATAVVQTFTVSGTISGSGGNGATVTLSGASSATTTANGAGAYSFTGMANGSYTVTPSHSGFTFGPVSQNATVSGGNVTVPAFTATAVVQTFTISGTISGSGGNGATVALSGAASATTTANSSGSYTFTGLANGTYAVTPGNSGFNFSPAVQSVTINGGNVTVPVFTATAALPTFSISGTITPAATGSGATVTLSGAATATTTANSAGAFTFTGLANGSYTVMPSSSTATFSPSSQNVTVNGSNASVSFTTTATSNAIFFDDFTESALSSDWLALDVNANVNSQQECYIPSQDTLSGGYLVITTLAQSATCSGTTKSYTSGAVVWSTFNFTYGTIEFRAKMPGGSGPWPAIWMLGHDCQPSSPTIYNASTCRWHGVGSEEIDIAEILDSNHTVVNQGAFLANGTPDCRVNATDVSQNFHVYDLVWSVGSLTWKIDGTTTCTANESDVPSQAMYLIINTAVGGTSGGTVVNSTLPQTMQVDYVKVTQP